MRSIEQLAQAAHEAFFGQAENTIPGCNPAPPYDQLPADQKTCWIAAVQAVRKEIEAVH